jgi:hypothetical protein
MNHQHYFHQQQAQEQPTLLQPYVQSHPTVQLSEQQQQQQQQPLLASPPAPTFIEDSYQLEHAHRRPFAFSNFVNNCDSISKTAIVFLTVYVVLNAICFVSGDVMVFYIINLFLGAFGMAVFRKQKPVLVSVLFGIFCYKILLYIPHLLHALNFSRYNTGRFNYLLLLCVGIEVILLILSALYIKNKFGMCIRRRKNINSSDNDFVIVTTSEQQTTEPVQQQIEQQEVPHGQPETSINMNSSFHIAAHEPTVQMVPTMYPSASIFSQEPTQQHFASQLISLRSMGFSDERLNIQLLEKYNGDLVSVIRELIETQ